LKHVLKASGYQYPKLKAESGLFCNSTRAGADTKRKGMTSTACRIEEKGKGASTNTEKKRTEYDSTLKPGPYSAFPAIVVLFYTPLLMMSILSGNL